MPSDREIGTGSALVRWVEGGTVGNMAQKMGMHGVIPVGVVR